MKIFLVLKRVAANAVALLYAWKAQENAECRSQVWTPESRALAASLVELSRDE